MRPVDVLIERIGTSLPYEWGNADDEGVPWEGGYVWTTHDTYDLLTEALGDILFNDSELVSDVVDALPEHAWVEHHPLALRLGERLSSPWEASARSVKHHRRYFFSDFRYPR